MSEWKESYNTHTRTIVPKLLQISISWESSSDSTNGFRVCIGTRRLTKLFGDLDCAKRAGLNFAKMICHELQTSIVSMETEIRTKGEQ